MKVTDVFHWNEIALNSDKRFVINEGGSRSSKTYSLCQLLIIWARENENKVISIVRKTFPSLRATVMRDFFEVLRDLSWYDVRRHNKSEHIYLFESGTIVEFFSVDDEQKVRGRKRDICWCNEANELYYDDFFQLNLRTTTKFFFDYNPSDSSSYLYELPREDRAIIKSTYLNNGFLEKAIVKEIESLKYKDDEKYQIFALGNRTTSRQNVYTGWRSMDVRPSYFEQFIYGLDFGYNHPTALVRTWYNEDELFFEKVIYESYLTTSDLIQRFIDLNIENNVEIMADHARPEIITELKRAGYYIREADKAVKKGIDDVKSFKVNFLKDKDIERELDNYRWKKVKDSITDEVVKLNDDFMDAARYSVRQIKKISGLGYYF